MKRKEQIRFLIEILLEELPAYRPQAAQFAKDEISQRWLLRSLMNVRPPMPIREDFLEVQDALLSAEREEIGVIDVEGLPASSVDPEMVLWQGDITRLNADAIVDADNSALLGCFQPCHGCIDNAIHSAAGLQLRDECNRIMQAQGYPEPNGQAKLTKGYNLPTRYVLHTVGPIVHGQVTQENRDDLMSCYRSCLSLAAEHKLETVAFCCITTGEYRIPNREAAMIAVQTVKNFLNQKTSIRRVIFNVFKDIDATIYRELL